MAKHFNMPAAEEKIEAYEDFVEEFCHFKMAQHSYILYISANQRYLFSSEAITFKLEWIANEKTLADIQGLLRKTFDYLAIDIHIVVVGGGKWN